MFEKASKRKLRFDSKRGPISTEDLWDVPLTSTNGFSLNDIAKSVSKDLKNAEEESFVEPTTKANTLLELKMEVVKHIIKVRLEEANSKEQAKEKKEKKARLLELIKEKEDKQLGEKSIKELQKEIDAL